MKRQIIILTVFALLLGTTAVAQEGSIAFGRSIQRVDDVITGLLMGVQQTFPFGWVATEASLLPSGKFDGWMQPIAIGFTKGSSEIVVVSQGSWERSDGPLIIGSIFWTGRGWDRVTAAISYSYPQKDTPVMKRMRQHRAGLQ